MSLIVAILLYVFGLDAATGTLNFKCDTCEDEKTEKTGNLIYSSSTYKRENIVRHPHSRRYIDTSYSETPVEETNGYYSAPSGSSDPQYESFEINNENV
jgi:hypothetical protein